MHALKNFVRSLIPAPVLSLYHLSLAYVGSLIYGKPSSKITVIAVTGTKGKTSTTEMVNGIFEAAGYTTALLNSIRLKIADSSVENPAGRSMPGRFFIQRFLANAIKKKCTVAVVEMTSEGARQYRHRFIELDALIFTNIEPEHIESHGSYENYKNAKFEIGKQLVRSKKRPRIIVAPYDDEEGARYLSLPVEKKVPFTLAEHEPYQSTDTDGYFTVDNTRISISRPGAFSIRNALAAALLSNAFDIPAITIAKGLSNLKEIPGRVQRIEAGQDFDVIVDEAHTPGSLKALCDAYKGRRRICVLGSAGGGRDAWKRPVMGKTAEENADYVILTNDDPYDDDPISILRAMESGMKRSHETIPDRREAIRKALHIAQKGDVVLITGKGIDPIMGPHGTKIPWNDADVARVELQSLVHGKL
jgi:UDP-N-acetylmuramoyl-L-alanyl-D-glutamate--2,6-diaminopimelate ligase